MSERTFRAVVASVLVGALVLAIVVVAVLLPRPAQPAPSASPVPSIVSTPAPLPSPTPSPGPAFEAPEVVGVGPVSRGASSSQALELKFVEPSIDAIPDAPGSFTLTLTDQAGDGSTVALVGAPSVDAPGSLGVTVALAAPNVLVVSIVASDNVEVEPITIRGLGIKASSTAALGALRLQLGDFTGSLAGGVAGNVVPSPGTVVAGQ